MPVRSWNVVSYLKMARSYAELFVKTKSGFLYKILSFVQRQLADDKTRELIAFFGHQIDVVVVVV